MTIRNDIDAAESFQELKTIYVRERDKVRVMEQELRDAGKIHRTLDAQIKTLKAQLKITIGTEKAVKDRLEKRSLPALRIELLAKAAEVEFKD